MVEYFLANSLTVHATFVDVNALFEGRNKKENKIININKTKQNNCNNHTIHETLRAFAKDSSHVLKGVGMQGGIRSRRDRQQFSGVCISNLLGIVILPKKRTKCRRQAT